MIILCLFFNLSKNFNRIIKSNLKLIGLRFYQVNFLTKEMDGFKINFPDQKAVNPKKKLCWSTPYICSVSQGENLKFYKKYTYTFVASK